MLPLIGIWLPLQVVLASITVVMSQMSPCVKRHACRISVQLSFVCEQYFFHESINIYRENNSINPFCHERFCKYHLSIIVYNHLDDLIINQRLNEHESENSNTIPSISRCSNDLMIFLNAYINNDPSLYANLVFT